jgi:hypothetical protein
MFSPHPMELLVVLLYLAVPLALAYLVIRLAVRHGTIDAHRRLRSEGSPAQGDDLAAPRP